MARFAEHVFPGMARFAQHLRAGAFGFAAGVARFAKGVFAHVPRLTERFLTRMARLLAGGVVVVLIDPVAAGENGGSDQGEGEQQNQLHGSSCRLYTQVQAFGLQILREISLSDCGTGGTGLGQGRHRGNIPNQWLRAGLARAQLIAMTFWSDLRYAARVLRKSPSYTAISVVTLAFGIGATTATFSTDDGMMWKPVALRNLNRLAVVVQRVPGDPTDYHTDAPADVADLRKRATSFDGIAMWQDGRANIVGAGGEPERVDQYLVSANFFDVLGEQPAIGRGFVEGEDQPGRDREVVLSERLWRRRFGADASIIGKTIRLDDEDYLVTGIMPRGFEFPKTAELWTPMALTPQDRGRRDSSLVMAIGRLKQDRTVAETAAEVDGASAQLAREYPATNQGRRYMVLSVQDYLVGYYNRHYLLLLLGAVTFVLLIACVNVANLQLARALGRGREVALRMALGAARGRLIRQLLTESVLLSLAGGLLGLAVASWGVDLIVGNMPPEVEKYISGWNEIRLDGRALGMTILLSLATGIVAGLMPAFQCSRPNLYETLKEGGRGTSPGRSRHRLRGMLVAAEIALAVVLLVGAGLMVRSFQSMSNQSVALEPAKLLTLRLAITPKKYGSKPSQAQFYERVLERVATVPGVQAVAGASSMPYTQHAWWRWVRVEGQPDDPRHRQTLQTQTVSPTYFSTLRVPLLQGRLLSRADGPDASRVAVIDDMAVRRLFAGADPIGKRIRLALDDSEPWETIV